MCLRILVCLLLAVPAIQTLNIHDETSEELSNGKVIDITRIEDQEDEVCTNKNGCNKKGGTCISKEETCIGNAFIGDRWCENSNTCQCCVGIDCQSKMNTACSVLNGTCIGINDVCDGRVAVDKVFCKNPSTCKCCFPKEISECDVSKLTTGATTTTQVTNGAYTCELSPEYYNGENECNESQIDLVGENTTFTSSNEVYILGKTIGIRFLPGSMPEIDPDSPHPYPGSRIFVTVESPSYYYNGVLTGFFTIQLTEWCRTDGCTWNYLINYNAEEYYWDGTSIGCLPKNEWILITFRENYGTYFADLTIRGKHYFSLYLPVKELNNTVTIKADVRNRPTQHWYNTQHYSEISLECNGVEFTEVTNGATTQHLWVVDETSAVTTEATTQHTTEETSAVTTEATTQHTTEGCSEGLFQLGTGECFKYFGNFSGSWTEAKDKCAEEGLILAEPSDQVAANLAKYIMDTYGDGFYAWLGARVVNSTCTWEHKQTQMIDEHPLWWDGVVKLWGKDDPQCLQLSVSKLNWNARPGWVYLARGCIRSNPAVCQEL